VSDSGSSITPGVGSPALSRSLAYGAVLVGLAYLALMLVATDGHFVPQIADLYVVCQYARALAEGHPFQYNLGEPPSTGSTSLLHTLVLGGAHALGFRGEWLIAFAIALGGAAYVAGVVLARRAAARLAPPREALLAGGLVLLGGPVVWGFLSGSDVALFMLLFLWLFERLLARSGWGVAAAGTLLALARPEGLVIGVLLWGSAFWVWPEDRKARRLVGPERLEQGRLG